MLANLRLAAGTAAVLALLVVPGLAGADPSAARPDGVQAWFVQLAPGGKQTFEANAAADGLQVKERYAFSGIWNGVSVSVPASQAPALSSVDGVQAVFPVEPVSLPEPQAPVDADGGIPADEDMATAVQMERADVAQSQLGLTGKGVKVALVDSGVDYTNSDLGGCFGAGCKVVGGWDFVGDAYDANPANTTYSPTPQPDSDPEDCDPLTAASRASQSGAGASNAGHGTHVAGIVAANGAVKGVAPDASLLEYRIFGCNGSTDSDVILAAMQRAADDGADVINMSFGASFENWPEYPTAAAADNLVARGITVVAAVGNAGNAGGLYGAGAPSVGRDVISVGSIDNAKINAATFDVGDGTTTLHVPYLQMSGSADAPGDGTSGDGDIVYLGRGCPAGSGAGGNPPLAADDPYPADPSGKIALIERGYCLFDDKERRAVAAGAKAIVFMNNVPGFFSGAGASIDVPAVTVSQADGNAIRALGSPRSFTWTTNRVSLADPTAGTISSFSAWGPDAELALKPDVVAPGGFIYSTWPTSQYGGHNLMSGTSMSAPQMAGAAALYLEAHPGASPRRLREAFTDTASPVLLIPGLADSVHHQGGGLIQIDKAITSPVVADPTKLSFGEGSGGTRSVTLVNDGDAPVTYSVSHLAGAFTGPNTFAVARGLPIQSASFSAPTLTVPAHGSASVNLTVAVNPAAPDRSLYGGYAVFTPVGGGTTLRVPYIGLKGDYQSIVALGNGGCALPGLFKQDASATTSCASGAPIAGYASQPSGATYTLSGDDFPVLLYHLDHQVRKLRIQVLSAKTGQPIDSTYPDADNEDYLARSSTPTAFFAWTWDGKRSFQDKGQGKWHRRAVPDGRYLLKVSVLKALGDASNPAHWESWTSPPVTLARTSG